MLLNARTGGEWVLSDEPPLALPFAQSIRRSRWGLPGAAPEVLAFYKATAYFGANAALRGATPEEWARPHDTSDFEALLPLLSEGRRRWLRASIATLHPDHPWLPGLDEFGGAGPAE